MLATAKLDTLARLSASDTEGTCGTASASGKSRLEQLFDKLEVEYKANDPWGSTGCHPLMKVLRVTASTSLRHCMEVEQVDMSEPLADWCRSSTTPLASVSDYEATKAGAPLAFDRVVYLAQHGANSGQGEGASPEDLICSSTSRAALGISWEGRGWKIRGEPSEEQSRDNDAEEARLQSADWMFEMESE